MDKQDVIHIDVPIFIRLLELSREEIKDDAPIHILTDKVIELSKAGTVTMDDYEDIVSSYKHKNKENQLSELRRLSGL